MPPRFAILVPTFRRPKLLARFVEGLLAQTHDGWTAILVHDGPDASGAFARLAAGATDPRLRFHEPSRRIGEWGWPVRLCPEEWIRGLNFDYVLLWDDDNLFFPWAIESVAAELERAGWPELLLAPLRYRGAQLPALGVAPHRLREKQVDSANLVLSAGLWRRICDRLGPKRKTYTTDYACYRAAVALGAEIVAPPMEAIAVYDGLRAYTRASWLGRSWLRAGYWTLPRRLGEAAGRFLDRSRRDR